MQTQCAFYKMGHGCQKCDECGTEPYLVEDKCMRCWNCENDAGELRWGDNDNEVIQEEKEKQEEKKPRLIKLPRIPLLQK